MRILTVGTPYLDFVVKVTDAYLAENVGEKESFDEIAGLTAFNQMLQNLPAQPIPCPGGSALNTAKGLQGLGNHCEHIGVIGDDEAGRHILEGLKERGIGPHLQVVEGFTGQLIGYVTPGGNRTFRNFFGVSPAMADLKIDPGIFDNCGLVHLDGYTILFPGLCERVMKSAKEKGVAVSFNMPAFTVVKEKKGELLDLLKKYATIVFSNKKEAFELTGKAPKEACEELQTLCPTAVVTEGKKGAWTANAKEGLQHFDSIPTPVVDTLGAGDYFVAGYLHAYLQNKPAKECAVLGARLASEVIQIVGADLPAESIKCIKD